MRYQPHSFHIPVMGTGFTIDTPLKVARYGISSVISLVDDVLIEQVRKFHCDRLGEPFEPIGAGEDDARARRITAYLNLVDGIVRRQSQALQAAPFEDGSEITRYFRMLPDSPLKTAYEEMLGAPDGPEKDRRQALLRPLAVPGSIDVNIMTKLDSDAYRDGQKLPPECADAMAALRGFARSALSSAIIFSAGINQRLYRYAATFDDFFADESGQFKKTIILKVSDFHSAEVQGKFLAKRGLWVSEFRIESGLNCGGHAFATDGHLLGPVLEEFKQKRPELILALREAYLKALDAQGRPASQAPGDARITVQGGIGTALENDFLLRYYLLDGTGWGTPFLLVPEATNVDRNQLEKLLSARPGDVFLSDSSPLGVPFWNLRTSSSEEARRRRNDRRQSRKPLPQGVCDVQHGVHRGPGLPGVPDLHHAQTRAPRRGEPVGGAARLHPAERSRQVLPVPRPGRRGCPELRLRCEGDPCHLLRPEHRELLQTRLPGGDGRPHLRPAVPAGQQRAAEHVRPGAQAVRGAFAPGDQAVFHRAVAPPPGLLCHVQRKPPRRGRLLPRPRQTVHRRSERPFPGGARVAAGGDRARPGPGRRSVTQEMTTS